MLLEQAKEILVKARALEKGAEVNCDLILHELAINGYRDAVEKIKNDEIRHWDMVDRLIKMLE